LRGTLLNLEFLCGAINDEETRDGECNRYDAKKGDR
jgi:hypothetical protein